MIEEINRLKKEKNAVILAHFYVPDEVQQIADYVGDSYYLAKVARETEAEVIVFCGVGFMGESAKLLNLEKKVLLPDANADCAMAHMICIEKIKEMKQKNENLAVVCYINSTAEIKAYSDVCVTSSNAVKIVRNMDAEEIFFIPDGNLGRYVAEQVPEKRIICNDGYCPIHAEITKTDVEMAKSQHPDAELLVHPECKKEVVDQADYVGSTKGIIEYATQRPKEEFIIGTETGVFYQLKNKNPNKKFYPIKPVQCCRDMKLVTLEKVRDALLYEQYEVEVSEEISTRAQIPLQRMLELGK